MGIRLTCFAVLAATVLVAQPEISQATSLNIDFGDQVYGGAPSNYGAYANQVGTWNVITATGTTNLVGLNGAALPGVSINLSSQINPGGFVGPLPNLSQNDKSLIGDNFFTIQNAWSVTLSGLTNGRYNLYVYSPANIVVPTSSYIVNGVTEHNLFDTSGTTTSPLTLGTNYDIDSVLVSNGSILITSGLDNGVFSGLAGLQLVFESPITTPLPAALPVFATGLGMMGLLGWRRKRKARA